MLKQEVFIHQTQIYLRLYSYNIKHVMRQRVEVLHSTVMDIEEQLWSSQQLLYYVYTQ